MPNQITNEAVAYLLDAEDALRPFGTFIVVFTTGDQALPAYEAMPRDPMPDLSWRIGHLLKNRINAAFKMNSSIHDGALVFNRNKNNANYFAESWSCRLLPKKCLKKGIPTATNRGVAWNSCLAMSNHEGVDVVVLYSQSAFNLFEQGDARLLIRDDPKL